jgi:hypothetical protein
VRLRPLQAGAVALVVLLLVLLGVRVVSNDRASALSADVAAGKDLPAPRFALRRLDGAGRLDLTSLRGKGRLAELLGAILSVLRDRGTIRSRISAAAGARGSVRPSRADTGSPDARG